MTTVRIFPTRTSMTPTDSLAFVGYPPLPGFRPEKVDEIDISVTFTWDAEAALSLAEFWADIYPRAKIRIGGPAWPGNAVDGFAPGCYIRQGVTFTTRGCNNACPWCLVPGREGRLRELPIVPGHIVQDNNLLQASPEHQRRVWNMLKTQHGIMLAGGLDARLVTDNLADELCQLRLDSVFLATDTAESLKVLRKAIAHLRFLPRRKVRVYVMVGYNGETVQQAETRLEQVWEAGGLPFCQLYQPADHWIDYGSDWKQLHRTWSRPAAMFAMHKEVMP